MMRKAIITACLWAATALASAAAGMQLTNVVCFVRFSDQTEATRLNDAAAMETLMNASDAEAQSVWRYYHDVSYGKLSWNSLIVNVDYTDSHPRGYFCKQSDTNPDGYSTIVTGYMREQVLIKDLCAAIESQVPEDAMLDGNHDGEIDNLMIVVLGNSDISSSNLLWPHQNTMFWAKASIRGCDVNSYLMVFAGTNGAHPINAGVMCHEMMHALDAYDLYSSGSLNPVGKWDLMSDNQPVPQGLTAYMRHTYGSKWGNWIPSITTLTQPGTYTLKPIFSESCDDVAYIIHPDLTRSEYFMVEYRRKTGWDASIPSSGLICYRINPEVAGNLSASKFEEYIFRPDGSLTSKGTIEKANFNSTVRRSSFGVDDKYYPFYSDGTRAQFALTDIGKAEESGITFTLRFPTSAIDEVTVAHTGISYDAMAQVVTAPGCSIVVYSATGQVVARGTGEVSLGNLPAGLYVARGSNNATIKILK